MHHDLKLHPQHFNRVKDGSKTYEIRENDRGYQQGDTVKFFEFDPSPINPTSNAPKGYTDEILGPFKVGYITVLDRETVVFSLIPVPKSKPDSVKKKNS
jgi:hypothetical protein